MSAFDEQGREVAELAGTYCRVRNDVLARASAKTVFRRERVVARVDDVSAEAWVREADARFR